MVDIKMDLEELTPAINAALLEHLKPANREILITRAIEHLLKAEAPFGYAKDKYGPRNLLEYLVLRALERALDAAIDAKLKEEKGSSFIDRLVEEALERYMKDNNENMVKAMAEGIRRQMEGRY